MIGLVIGGGVRLIAAGAAVGLVASLLATRLVQAYLIAVSPFDGAAFASAATVLLAVTTAAAYLPSRRAARVSPLEAIRDSD